MFPWILVSSVIVLFDQLSKAFINKSLPLGGSIPVIKNVFHISLVYNTGAAFGIFKSQTNFFVLISIIAVILILITMKSASFGAQPLIYKLSLSFILAGASGNLIDRLRLGFVVDFIDLRIWPVFNVADSFVSIGCVLLVISLFKER